MENDATPVLSEEQIRAVAGHPGGTVRVIDPTTNRPYVLVSADEYERVKALAYDDSPWADEEMDRLAAESADALGWEGMDAYQDPTS
jgi:hypothetical protein